MFWPSSPAPVTWQPAISSPTPASTYLSPSERGLEAGDSVTISGPNQILFDTVASSPGDYVRVITAFSPTATTPEPGTLALFGMGLLAMAALYGRKRPSLFISAR